MASFDKNIEIGLTNDNIFLENKNESNKEKYILNNDDIEKIMRNVEDDITEIKKLSKSKDDKIKYIDETTKKIISFLKPENITSHNMVNIINILVNKIEK